MVSNILLNILLTNILLNYGFVQSCMNIFSWCNLIHDKTNRNFNISYPFKEEGSLISWNQIYQILRGPLTMVNKRCLIICPCLILAWVHVLKLGPVCISTCMYAYALY